MNTRKRQIQEQVQDFLATLAPNQQRFVETTRELQKGERKEIADDLKGVPFHIAKKLVQNLRLSGRLTEAKRNPDEILADIRSTENDIDRTFDNNQHHPHVKRLDKLHAEYMKVTGQRPPSAPEPTTDK
jgi:hypothetical protein